MNEIINKRLASRNLMTTTKTAMNFNVFFLGVTVEHFLSLLSSCRLSARDEDSLIGEVNFHSKLAKLC